MNANQRLVFMISALAKMSGIPPRTLRLSARKI